MNMVFWNRLPEGVQGAPVPTEINIFAIIIPVVVIGIVAYRMFSKRQRQHN